MLPVADSYNYRQLPLRGGVFVIAPEDRARFDAFMRRTGEFAELAGNPAYDFSAVDLYELANDARLVAQDFRTAGPRYAAYDGGAPVAQRVDLAAPRIARLAGSGATTWLTRAQLDAPAAYPACKTGAFEPADAVYCELTADDVRSGALASGDFQSAWLDGWSEEMSCDDTGAVRAFMTAAPGVRAGGSVLATGGAIGALEGAACDGPGLVASTAGAAAILRRPAWSALSPATARRSATAPAASTAPPRAATSPTAVTTRTWPPTTATSIAPTTGSRSTSAVASWPAPTPRSAWP